MLEVDRLASHYGRIQALHEISLEVGGGEIVALVGANGAGKTTLLRTISGVQPASAGRVVFDGVDITRKSPHARVGAGIVQVPEGRQMFGSLSVTDNLRLGAYLRRDRDIPADMERMFDMFPPLAERRHHAAGTMSGGQQQMLAIARAMMARPRLLLLDEPSMGLAPLLVDQIMATIAELKEQGVTIFLVEQNAYAALSIADRGYVLELGTVAMRDEAKILLSDDRVREAYLGMTLPQFNAGYRGGIKLRIARKKVQQMRFRLRVMVE